MKFLITLSFFAVSLISCASCSESSVPAINIDKTNPTGSKMKITIGNKTFSATLADNATATAFKTQLPLTVSMVELNGNEKYADLPRSIPTNAVNPGTIRSGDLMLYGSTTLVLFYKSFSTSYRYTKLGRIDDVTGLEDALGAGNVVVKFELESSE